jgi:DNA-directed RNA polymerase specialized sigma24 family protein
VQQLLGRYFQRLVQLARARLKGAPGLAGNDEDVALSEFKSLFLGAERDRFPQVADRDDLWRLLALMTVRKAIDLQRRHKRQEVPTLTVDEVLSREPPPELAAEMSDEYQRLLDRLGDTQLRAIALWKVEGYTNEEIAARLGCVVRSVERKLYHIRALWAEDLPA